MNPSRVLLVWKPSLWLAAAALFAIPAACAQIDSPSHQPQLASSLSARAWQPSETRRNSHLDRAQDNAVSRVAASRLGAAGQVGVPFTYRIPNTVDAVAYRAENLPPGLTLDASTGLIHGTPAKADTTTAFVDMTKADGTKMSATLSLFILVAPEEAGGFTASVE